MSKPLTTKQIVLALRRQGVSVTERRVRAARRGGQLSYTKHGHFIVSTECEVQAWAESGCQADDDAEPAYRRAPSTDYEMTDEEAIAAKLQTLEPEQAAAWVHGLQQKAKSLATEAAQTTTRATTAERVALEHEAMVLELETKLSSTEARLRRRAREIERLQRTIDELEKLIAMAAETVAAVLEESHG